MDSRWSGINLACFSLAALSLTIVGCGGSGGR